MPQLQRILLVEDDPRDVELTLAALEEFKLANEVVVARDGVTARDYLRRQGNFTTRPEGNPVVVLLDIKMPRLSGLEMLRIIKEHQHLKLIPVVMLTSSREEPDLQESYKLGVSAYVVKPMEFQKFTNAVKEIGIFWAAVNEPPPGSVPRDI